jgi:hypothetical protein
MDAQEGLEVGDVAERVLGALLDHLGDDRATDDVCGRDDGEHRDVG